MTPPDPRAGAAAQSAASKTTSGLPARIARQGAEQSFGRSFVLSATVHVTAIGCSLLIAYGVSPGLRGTAPKAHLVFADAPPETIWRLEEPEPLPEDSQVETPEEPPAELVPVEEEVVPEPFQSDPVLSEPVSEALTWTRVGPEPLQDLRERLAEQRRQQALAVALAAPPPRAPAAATAAPRGESRPLRLVDAPRPTYPRISLRLEEQGTVVVRIHVGPDGHVDDVDLLQTSGHERLDTAALQAVRQWRFDPQLRNGEAVAGTFDHKVVFVLERADER